MKVAIADPAAAPLGELAKEWLIREGMFQVLEQEKRLVIAGDILKTALAVKSGGADWLLSPWGRHRNSVGDLSAFPHLRRAISEDS